MNYTLGDVRQSVARFTGDSGMCPDDERVLNAINEARRILYPLGDWECLCEGICVCLQNCGITLPSEYDYIKTARACMRQVIVENHWFTQVSRYQDFCGDTNYHLVKKPGSFVTFCDWPDTECCGSECPEYGFYINVELEDIRDVGVKLTFHGRGSHVENLSLTRVIDTPPYRSSNAQPGEGRFIELKKVVKPKTFGKIRVYGNDGTNRLLLALYQPTDINPKYSRYYSPMGLGAGQNVIMNCKRRYVPLHDDEQICEIHPDALIHVLQGLTERESRNYQAYDSSIQMAVAYLNREQAGPESTSCAALQFNEAYRVDGLIC